MRVRNRWTALAAALAAALVLGGALTAGEKAARWEKESGLSEPKVIEKVDPAYPAEARKEGVQGVVVLEATIATDGRVAATEPVEDPDARLTAAAREAVGKWKFEPARDREGRAVAVRYRVTVAFKLQ